jgi:glycosyltransferase involved in cell wall biosynthesis
VTNSDATRNWLEKKSLSIGAKSVTIYNGLSQTPPVVKSESDGVRAFCNAAHTDIVVVLVGRISRWKGQKLFVDALELLVDKGHTAIRALIVGSPPAGQEHFKTDLVAYISESRAAEYIYLMDQIDNIWPVWAACDVAVVPSTEPEPFGMVAIEAMSAHKPVIAANHGGLVEIVEDGITGILVPPRDALALANAIEAIAFDAESRAQMGESGFIRQKTHFSLVAYIHAFESQYLDIASH